MEQGHIMLARKAFDHWLWSEARSLSKFEAWLDLLQLAAFAPYKRIIKGRLIELGRGELVASLRYLSSRWDWNKDKAASYLRLLELDSMIRRESRQGQTVITLLNFERYNTGSDSKSDSESDKVQTVARQWPDKGEEGEEDKEEEGPEAAVPLVTIQQSREMADLCGLTKLEAEHWWHTRNAAGWTRGSVGGAPARPITSAQSDMASSKRWIRESLAKEKQEAARGGATMRL